MANETARIVRFHSVGGPEVLKIEEEPIPQPGKSEVRLNVKALGLNRAEVMFRRGEYLETPVLPSKLGYEAAGIVAAVGPDVEKSWLGKKTEILQLAELHRDKHRLGKRSRVRRVQAQDATNEENRIKREAGAN